MQGDDLLREQAEEFARRLQSRLALIVPSENLAFSCEAARKTDGTALITVASSEPNGIVLTIDGNPRLQVEVEYRLIHSPVMRFMTVLKSGVRVRAHGVPKPLFTLDYEREAGANIPGAHYNFHFEHDSVVQELLATGRARRGRGYQKAVAAGKPPRLADLHFPVGGHRFRPCLEDVLDLLWAEFGIDVVSSTARRAIDEGRQEWRRTQLKAAVSDDPTSAVEELERLGFQVIAPEEELTPRADRLTAL